jgi:hypothetical protein
MRPLTLAMTSGASRRAVYRLFRDCGQAGLDIGLLSIADHLAVFNGPGDRDRWRALLAVVEQLFRHYFYHYTDTIRPAAILGGRDLMERLNITSGPEIGHVLRAIEEAQAAGDVNTYEEALELARSLIDQ